MTSATTISVVIPTFDRRRQLERTLESLARQDGLDHGFEVVVVDDGSSDDTAEWMRSDRVPRPIIPVSQPNGGPAAARNRGVEAASGDVILFLDDDVVPLHDLVAAHLRHHAVGGGDAVVIGPMRTPHDEPLSPWVRWEQKQLDKQYEAMIRGDWAATPRQFFTGNASLARRHLDAAGGFDPTFRRAEDVELAYRLADAGLEFVFAPDAVVVHHAQRPFAAWRAAANEYGRNDAIFGRDHDRVWLLESVLSEFHDRHPLVRTSTRLSMRSPLLAPLISVTIAFAARALGRTGPRELSDAALSGLYNLEYYGAMATQLGGRRELLRLLDAAAER